MKKAGKIQMGGQCICPAVPFALLVQSEILNYFWNQCFDWLSIGGM